MDQNCIRFKTYYMLDPKFHVKKNKDKQAGQSSAQDGIALYFDFL